MDPEIIIDGSGQERRLAFKHTEPDTRARFKAFSATIPNVPESDWFPVDHRGDFDESYVLDQKSKGSCVGFSSTAALMKCRAMTGQTYAKLSGSYTYSFINGGRDDGASIGDALDSLQEHGTCLDSEAGWDAIYPRNIPAKARQTAMRFRCEEGYRIETWAEAVTAILKGYVIVYAVMVGNTFDRLDSDGIVGLDRGSGNHAVHACGLHQSSGGVWCLDGWNSWSAAWGDRGRFRTTRRHWDGVQQDAFAVRSVTWDPEDVKQLPKVS